MKLAHSILAILSMCVYSKAIELKGYRPIGSVIKSEVHTNGTVLSCSDGSKVSVSVVAEGIVRVRASFGADFPLDHSWAVVKKERSLPKVSVETGDSLTRMLAGDVVVEVAHSPLLITFRDRSGRVVNSDHLPMMSSEAGSVLAVKRLGFEERFYGLGEKAARLEKRRGSFQMWNRDKPAYTEGEDPLYQSIPFYIGLENGVSYGIYFDNSYRSYFDLGRSSQEYITFAADGGEMDYYYIHGLSMKTVVERFAELTGHMPMPPKWALGHQQSRWSYYPDTLAEKIVREYRARDLPLDALYLDIHHMSGYRVFTWDRKYFPDPKGFTERLQRLGVKVVTIVDPGVKYQPSQAVQDFEKDPELADSEKSYYVYTQGLAKDYFLRRENGELFIGEVWPGKSVFVDYTKADARRWWGRLHRAYTDYGVAGIWNDMNEPADFIDQTGKSQMDVVSYDEGRYTRHSKNRNLFALLMAQATFEGLKELRPTERPFVLTRAGFAGIQRYAATWTGDNSSTWESLQLSLPMLQSLGLSGQPFVGGDIGGFIGRADGELLTRWYQAAMLVPFFRNHMEIGAYDHEPWRFGSFYEEIIRGVLKTRYRLLPYLYTYMEQAHRTGLPVLRPLVLEFQDDSNTHALDDQYMVGESLLIAPVMRPSTFSRLCYLPKGIWYDYWTGSKYQGGRMYQVSAPIETVPFFVRGGSIVAATTAMNYVYEKPESPLELLIYPDASGNASGEVYEDDGKTMDFERGLFRRTTVKLEHGTVVIDVRGEYKTPARRLILRLYNSSRPSRVHIDGVQAGWEYKDGVTTILLDDTGKKMEVVIK